MRIPVRTRHFLFRGSSAFTLVEVLIAMGLILIGVTAAAAMLHQSVRDTQHAVDVTTAAYLAQLKAEEVRRDDNTAPSSYHRINDIKAITKANATTLVTWPQDTRFAYGFCGESVTAPVGADTTATGDIKDRSGVARVIICYSMEFKPRAVSQQYDPKTVLYELRFDY